MVVGDNGYFTTFSTSLRCVGNYAVGNEQSYHRHLTRIQFLELYKSSHTLYIDDRGHNCFMDVTTTHIDVLATFMAGVCVWRGGVISRGTGRRTVDEKRDMCSMSMGVYIETG
ncbi:hypothetical protein Tco_1011452 [Tanacetum coccineum]